ncbi:MAG: hypothetical protein SV375_14470, partial [Thermodesulfobacteriota bacterium]|nr:hypothetical protein [Thermodesulfobacteriota bacterium]
LSWVVKAIQQGIYEGIFHRCEVQPAASILWATMNGVLELMGGPIRHIKKVISRRLLMVTISFLTPDMLADTSIITSEMSIFV